MTVKAGSREIRIGMVSGLAHAVKLIDGILSGKKRLDMLEVMACPGGCVNGGGQPLPVDENLIRNRSRAVYDMDNGGTIQTAHGNQDIRNLYERWLVEPGSNVCRDLLFTMFSKREVL
jgi:iron only hydrogenase large subunit-like protein